MVLDVYSFPCRLFADGGKYMVNRVKLPIGIENFEEFRTEGFYYVDKTGFI